MTPTQSLAHGASVIDSTIVRGIANMSMALWRIFAFFCPSNLSSPTLLLWIFDRPSQNPPLKTLWREWRDFRSIAHDGTIAQHARDGNSATGVEYTGE